MTILPKIGKPATNALHTIGVNSLEQVSAFDQATLLKIHGIGPKAIAILEEALAEHNLAFKETSINPTQAATNFAVLCALNCDNAPKRRLIRDYLIAAAASDQQTLRKVLAPNVCFISPGNLTLDGIERFIDYIKQERVEISTLDIQSIVTHGKEGAAHGSITTKKGAKHYFATMLLFSGNQKEAPIKQVTSFVISSLL
ncbi:DNA-binding protein [Enterococcus termitis]|uniref:DNA-binding protein n=1 Tax=Enterococcus termitis TaxID=332950 RepID=A0A1E5GBL5_9ENTE|nr:DNA-binding protein [Enterococcus termitis]OEG09985.1 DNA-binding protein [Enterococcus termitis]